MKNKCLRVAAIAIWFVIAGTGLGVRTVAALNATPACECYEIGGVIYCVCTADNAPPGYMPFNGYLYCPTR